MYAYGKEKSDGPLGSCLSEEASLPGSVESQSPFRPKRLPSAPEPLADADEDAEALLDCRSLRSAVEMGVQESLGLG